MNTTNLELSRELREAGYPQESYFYWEKWITEEEGYSLLHYISITEWNEDDKNRMFASPTADEILERLPLFIKDNGHGRGRLVVEKGINGWTVGYINDWGRMNKNDKSLADAVAKMWLYLKKNNLL
jgi:hypothetical protein